MRLDPYGSNPPATMNACADVKGGSGWTHPSFRKSGTCMADAVSNIRQLGELLDKAAYIVPVHDDVESQSWSNYPLSSSSSTSTIRGPSLSQ